jgi:tetrahydromethanopterin S-methyltransferase subunit E
MSRGNDDKERPMADVGPPIALIAVGLILWLAVTATIAGISIQTIGLILFLIGVVWLVIELVLNGRRRAVATRERVVDRPATREREVL